MVLEKQQAAKTKQKIKKLLANMDISKATTVKLEMFK
jgi:hypothetical protein